MSTEKTSLTAILRTSEGKGGARRLRTSGKIPAVIYGKGFEPAALAIDPLELKRAISTPHKFNTVITIKLEKGDRLVLLKDYQQHPLTRQLLHADFQEVRLDQQVTVEVPIALVGKAIGTADGGILGQVKRTISIKCLPGQIPAALEVDVTALKIGQSLHEVDIILPEGAKLAGSKNETLATISVPEAEAAPVVAAAAAPVAGAPAAGAPAAAGAKAGDAKAPAAGAKAAAPAAGAKAPAAKK